MFINCLKQLKVHVSIMHVPEKINKYSISIGLEIINAMNTVKAINVCDTTTITKPNCTKTIRIQCDHSVNTSKKQHVPMTYMNSVIQINTTCRNISHSLNIWSIKNFGIRSVRIWGQLIPRRCLGIIYTNIELQKLSPCYLFITIIIILNDCLFLRCLDHNQLTNYSATHIWTFLSLVLPINKRTLMIDFFSLCTFRWIIKWDFGNSIRKYRSAALNFLFLINRFRSFEMCQSRFFLLWSLNRHYYQLQFLFWNLQD